MCVAGKLLRYISPERAGLGNLIVCIGYLVPVDDYI